MLCLYFDVIKPVVNIFIYLDNYLEQNSTIIYPRQYIKCIFFFYVNKIKDIIFFYQDTFIINSSSVIIVFRWHIFIVESRLMASSSLSPDYLKEVSFFYNIHLMVNSFNFLGLCCIIISYYLYIYRLFSCQTCYYLLLLLIFTCCSYNRCDVPIIFVCQMIFV